jgi:hypothetical protein
LAWLVRIIHHRPNRATDRTVRVEVRACGTGRSDRHIDAWAETGLPPDQAMW